MMIHDGKKVRLTAKERDSLSIFAGECVNPETIDEYNAWWDHIKQTTVPLTPEERLLVAMADHMKVSA